jgi:hypothetical protein
MSVVTRSTAPPETALYEPVKALLEAQGYLVKGEIVGCDVVGIRGDEPPVVVELKRSFGIALVLQGIDRLALTDAVYLAVGAWPRQTVAVRRLCRRLGLASSWSSTGGRSQCWTRCRTGRARAGGGRPDCSQSTISGSVIRRAEVPCGARS